MAGNNSSFPKMRLPKKHLLYMVSHLLPKLELRWQKSRISATEMAESLQFVDRGPLEKDNFKALLLCLLGHVWYQVYTNPVLP